MTACPLSPIPADSMPRKRPRSTREEDPPSKRPKAEHSNSEIVRWITSITPASREEKAEEGSCPLTDPNSKRKRLSDRPGDAYLSAQNLHHVPAEEFYNPAKSITSQSFSGSQFDGSNSVGPTEPDYESRLKERNIYCMRKTKEPSNLQELKVALAATRQSPEPDENIAEGFPRRVRKSGNEGGAMQGLLPKVLPIIDRFWDSDNDAHPVDQQWDRRVLLDPHLRPSLKPPKPDQAFGFTPDTFPFPQATLFMKSVMFPARDLTWPYFTIETKGRQGHLDIARLQNSHNGAVMMNNMLQLKRELGKEYELLGRIVVMTMELTTESIALSGQFTTANAAGTYDFDSICLYCASAIDPTGKAFKESYKQAMNAVERFRKQTMTWVMNDMAALDDRLIKATQQSLNQITPPASHFGRSQSHKRGSSRRSSRSTSRSESLSRKKSTLSCQTDAPESDPIGNTI